MSRVGTGLPFELELRRCGGWLSRSRSLLSTLWYSPFMLDNRIATRKDIAPALLDASHVVVREGRQPCRIVLYKGRDQDQLGRRPQWIVHKECLTTKVTVDGTSCAFSHVSFSDGDYCDSLEKAQAKFAERSASL